MTDAVIAPGTAAPFDGPGPVSVRPDHQFPGLLRSHRERAGLTQRALADLSTISTRAIRDLEAGRANARTQTIRLLADGLRLSGLARELFIHSGLSSRPGTPVDVDPAPAVPEPVNALLGRDVEVRAMAESLESGRRRVVSICGLPGVGKTRVAAEVATRLSARRGWPVLWLGKDPSAGQGSAFGPLMRAVRSVIESDSQDVSRVWQVVGRHDALLVLDGFADQRTPVGVEELLAYCPGVRVISTSRMPWQLTGVQATVIAPLATPGPEWDARRSLDSLAGVPSVRLLVDRLADVRPGFMLSPTNAGPAVEICRRLDGLPLALEAVASRFRVLSLHQLTEVPAAQLLDLAVPGRQHGPAETIGDLLGSSVQRLVGPQRGILMELARNDRPRPLSDLARDVHRSLDEVVDDLSVLIGFGMVQATHDETTTTLSVLNLLRAYLLRDEAPPDRTERIVVAVGTDTTPKQAAAPAAEVPPPSTDDTAPYNPADALRDAGILGGQMSPELEDFYANLTREETETLISVRNRLVELLPDVVAHEGWSTPEATSEQIDAAMLCACGAWSGSGSGKSP
jgi:transcriptional regulator with XRE-family HTH domain